VRQTLRWFFDRKEIDVVKFTQFCAVIAMFGPTGTAIRKAGHFLECPKKLVDAVTLIELGNLEAELGDSPANAFKVQIDDADLTVYNIPYVDTSESYLIDQDGVCYASWLDFYEKHSERE
jgi:hypothetical protein